MINIKQLLNALSKSTRGKIHLINIWDSCEDSLITKSVLKKFAKEFVLELSKNPTESISNIFEKTCQQKNSRGKYRFLRIARVSLAHHSAGNPIWSRVDRWDSFFRYHLTDKFKRAAHPGIPILPYSPPPGQTQLTRRNLAKVVSHPDWCKGGAILGRPAKDPYNCWVSDADLFVNKIDEPCADTNRDQRGLDYVIGGTHLAPERTHLIAYTFERDSAIAAAGREVARPGFTDGGNKRFRAYDPSTTGRTLAGLGWGSTLNLEKLAINDNPSHVSGVSERIVPGLPIDKLNSLKVEYLGPITHLRGRTKFDNDEAFVQILLRGQSLVEVKNKIKTFVG